MGAPCKLSVERMDRIQAALLEGAPIGSAAAAGGIHEGTYRRWVARGRIALEAAGWDIELVLEEDRPFCAFSATVNDARHAWEFGQLATIQEAATGQPYRRTKTRTWDQAITLKDENGKNVQHIVQMTDVTVEEGVENDWRAGAWLLERRNPQEYGRATRLEVTGKDGGPIEVVSSLDLAIEELLTQFPQSADA